MRKNYLYSFCAIFATVFLLSACGSANSFNSVYATVSECELGSNFDLLKTVSHNEGISKITLSDKGGFDSNKVGTYDVSYSITDIKNKTKEKNFTYTVKDTTPPKLNLTKNEIHAKLGAAFDINDYVKATDNSNQIKIKYDGDVDTNKEGKYKISVYAIDDSNNKSKTQELEVYIDDRNDCIIRNAKFGDSIETVKAWENAKISSVNSNLEDSEIKTLVYDTKLNNVDMFLFYFFQNDKLVKIVYGNSSNYINDDSYVDDFYTIEDALEKKYGEPDSKKYRTDSAAYGLHEGFAISLGYASKYTLWRKDGYIITNDCYGNSDGTVGQSITYESDDFVATEIDNSDI